MLGCVAVLLLLFLGFVQQLLDITKAQQAFVFQRNQSATLLREALVYFSFHEFRRVFVSLCEFL